MTEPHATNLGPPAALDELLGWLNFSVGVPEPRFQRGLLQLYESLESSPTTAERPWLACHEVLQRRLEELAGHHGQAAQPAFADINQAEMVLRRVFLEFLPAYRAFHGDLLQHQRDAALFRPLFLARACEACLQLAPTAEDAESHVAGMVQTLNDYVGYRPLAVLQNAHKMEPYNHEWVCPIPLFVRDVGVDCGSYQEILQAALQALRQTNPELLEQAYFGLELLDEVALDPRAYDFDHPANKRPNHHFGQWDPQRIDRSGNYRRFVLQGVTLDSIRARLEDAHDLPRSELVVEAGTVLAGTMLMAAFISGRGPDTHDSSVTLAKLMPRIAAARDAFYQHWLSRIEGPHGERLRHEATLLHQPFGGARQHLNQRLARLRAAQLEHVHLALLFARMGHAEASARQSSVVPVTSARLLCEISSRLAIGQLQLTRAAPVRAAELLREIEDLMERGIRCGALVDPWNILGFQGNYSLFPAIENSVRDHRVDVFVHIMRQIFDLYVRTCGEAAATGDTELQDRVQHRLRARARWWDKFASVEVTGIERLSGREIAESAGHLADALGAWHAAGTAAGDIAFWRKHVARFQAPKAYALVVTALLNKRDYVAARALLMQWLSRADEVALVDSEYSLHELALRWMHEVLDESSGRSNSLDDPTRLELVRKFFDFFEANAEGLWEVPQLEFSAPRGRQQPIEDFPAGDEPTPDEDDAAADARFGAAYEHVTYRDSTGDGVEGDTLDGGPVLGEFPLEHAAARLHEQLPMMVTIARLWKTAAVALVLRRAPAAAREMLLAWHQRARQNAGQLRLLLAEVAAQRLPAPLGTQESLVEYDRRRLLKENVLARIILTSIEVQSAARLTLAAIADSPETDAVARQLAPWQQQAITVLRGLLLGHTGEARAAIPALQQALMQEPILYVPLAKNGAPEAIVAAQGIQQLFQVLLRALPRAGLLAEACQLIVTAQDMERTRPAGDGVVSEFDRLFEAGYEAIVDSLISAAQQQRVPDAEMIDALHEMTEGLLQRWLTHSRSLRLSVLERVSDKERWAGLVEFIKKYGHDVFTQRFMNLGNLRAILHQGVSAYLARLEADGECEWQLLEALDREVPRAMAAEFLTIAIEAVAENYAEYKDFNATTTQSDHGELLYVLLDFLRLKASYERFAWTIRPILAAHELLVRRQQPAAAELWRRAIVQRTGEVADWHLKRLNELVRQYGIRLPTVAGRLHERFVRVLAVDRMRSLIEPAVDELRNGRLPIACDLLEQEIDEFTENPTGAGLDVPAWLEALEEEAARVLDQGRLRAPVVELPVLTPLPPWDEIAAQAHSWDLHE